MQKEGKNASLCMVFVLLLFFFLGCAKEQPSEDWYLEKIEEYLENNKGVEVSVPSPDPIKRSKMIVDVRDFRKYFQVRKIEQGVYQGRNVELIHLSCCGMGGDTYYLDVDSGEVFTHKFGVT